MKKYTNYKVSLCIGLLSLNILSSCTNMRQELGVKKRQDKSSSCAQWCFDSHTLQNWKNAPCYSRCLCIPCLKQPLVQFIGSVFTLVVVGGVIYWVSSQPNAPITSDSVLPNCWNETDVSLSRTARSISSGEEQVDPIIGLVRGFGAGVLGTLGALYYRNDNNATSRNTRVCRQLCD